MPSSVWAAWLVRLVVLFEPIMQDVLVELVSREHWTAFHLQDNMLHNPVLRELLCRHPLLGLGHPCPFTSLITNILRKVNHGLCI